MKTFGVDENGIIITEVSIDKITPPFKIIVDKVLHAILADPASQLDSVYLYGSIATGKAVKGKSDLDIIVVFKEKANDELLKKISSLEAKLTKEYELIFRDVGLATTHVDDALSEKERLGGLCFLKHLSVCIYGDDITKNVSGFKPTKAVAKGFNGDIAKSLKSLKEKIKNAISGQEVKKVSQLLAKKIIRTAFSLVMPRAASWTTNLQTSVETFLQYYPEKTKEMNTVLGWSKIGTDDKEEILKFINTFGLWLTQKFKEEILVA